MSNFKLPALPFVYGRPADPSAIGLDANDVRLVFSYAGEPLSVYIVPKNEPFRSCFMQAAASIGEGYNHGILLAIIKAEEEWLEEEAKYE